MTDYQPPPQVAAPEAGINRARVRIRLNSGDVEIREVLVADAPEAWTLWAAEMRFNLLNTQFIDLGGTVYRTETIDKIDPIRDELGDPTREALQVALGALTVIGNGRSDGHHQQLAHEIVDLLAEGGFRLSAPEPESRFLAQPTQLADDGVDVQP